MIVTLRMRGKNEAVELTASPLACTGCRFLQPVMPGWHACEFTVRLSDANGVPLRHRRCIEAAELAGDLGHKVGP